MESQILGTRFHRLPFSFGLDFHPVVEGTALFLTSHISILVFGNTGL